MLQPFTPSLFLVLYKVTIKPPSVSSNIESGKFASMQTYIILEMTILSIRFRQNLNLIFYCWSSFESYSRLYISVFLSKRYPMVCGK